MPPSNLDNEFLLQAVSAQSGLRPELLDPKAVTGLVTDTVAHMKRRLFGQDEVLDRLGAALAARAAERHIGWDQAIRTLQPQWDRRPWLTALAVGPTGVGKSETAKILADRLFNGRLITLHGNDVGPESAHGTSTWTGSPPGYVGSDRGGTLTNALRQWSSAVILVEEIEKASADALQNILLTLMGDGGVSDRNNGDTLRATDCIVFCTSNIPIEPELVHFGFERRSDQDDLDETTIADAVRRHLWPEIVGRFNRILAYRALSTRARWRVWLRLQRGLCSQIGPGTRIILDSDARSCLADRLAAISTGARGIQDLFRMELIPLAAGCTSGDTVTLSADADRLVRSGAAN